MFTTINDESILNGTATDAYFLRTEAALKHADENPMVVADVSADQFGDNEFEVLAGLNDAVELLSSVSDDIDVWALPEGTLFDGGPVLRIRGPYLSFARYETSLLGFLSQASGIATNAFRTTKEADENTSVLSFGARHMHPKLAAVIERSALIGGVDGFSHVAAGEEIGKSASGTMPHALVLALNDQEKAWSAYNDSAPEDAERILLTDTFTDEADESLRAAKLLGDDLDGVRLDTTGSRRGSFRHIIKEVRWKLDDKGRDDVGIFVSGGLGPEDVRNLGDIVDGFGIGGFISNADPVDFSLDIVELNGMPTTKRGKLPGLTSSRA
jgi:Nicotinic acid phosphoribosyltransferase